MSDGLTDLLDDGSTDATLGQGGGALRKQLEAVLAQNKALTEQLGIVQATQRQTQLTSLAAKHSIPAKALDFFPKDAALSDETATAFVEQYGELWGAQAQTATTSPAEQAATSVAQAFAAQAGPAPTAPQSEDEYRAHFAQANTREEFLQMLTQLEAVGISG